MAHDTTAGNPGTDDLQERMDGVREAIRRGGRYRLPAGSLGHQADAAPGEGDPNDWEPSEGADALHPMDEYTPQVQTILRARAGSPDRAFAAQMEAMARATTAEEILEGGEAVNGEAIAGEPIHVLGYQVWPGSIADNDGHYRNFAVLDAIHAETGEAVIVTTSGSVILLQLAHLDRLGAFPITFALQVFETRSGRNVHRLKAHADYPVRAQYPLPGEAPASPAEASTNGGTASEPEPVTG
jgi:hypothetical protein